MLPHIEWSLSIGHILTSLLTLLTLGGSILYGAWRIHRCVEQRLDDHHTRLAVIEERTRTTAARLDDIWSWITTYAERRGERR